MTTVLKFGGTSVSTHQRWQNIAQTLHDALMRGERPFVVCSALSGISNHLEQLIGLARTKSAAPQRIDDLLNEVFDQHITLANAMQLNAETLLQKEFETLSRLILGASLIHEVSPKTHARIMSLGELMATKLGAAYLNKSGVLTRWYDARDWLIATRQTDHQPQRHYLSATCDFQPDTELQRTLADQTEAVALTQGFIARDQFGDTVLLGRGGSDTSAAYFAAKLEAERLEIWTDVPGIFTANPHHIPSARLLRQLDYDEARELATMGAKVLHPRCIEPVREFSIPLHIRNTENPQMEGTIISNETPDTGAQVKAVSAKTGITVISMNTIGMWQQVGFLADIFAVFKKHGVSVDLIGTSEVNVTVTLDPVANALDPTVMNDLLVDLGQYCEARALHSAAAISLVGHNIRSILHRLAPTLEVFVEQQIYLVSQSASDLNLTFVVDEEQADRLVRKLHALLFQNRKTDSLLGPTWHNLSTGTTETTAFENAWWRKNKQELLALAAQLTPQYIYHAPTLRESVETLQNIDAVDRIFYAMKANSHPEIIKLFAASGLGFECVSPGELDILQHVCPDLPREKKLFTPNFAPRAEYEFGFKHSGWLTIDNLHPVQAWPELFKGKQILVRIDPGQGYGHHKYVRTAGPQSKFGIAPDQLESLAQIAERVGFEIIGLHSHVGSGVRDADTWANTAIFLAKWKNFFPHARILNLGGGLGIPERPGQQPLDIQEMTRTLNRVKNAHPNFELWLEPGRYLVASAGVLLAAVAQLKQKSDMRYIGLDVGMNSLLRPSLYGAYHEIVNLTHLDAPTTSTANIVGPICESGDVLGHDRPVPTTHEGDIFLIANTGAYGHVMASHYNQRPPAPETFLKQ